MRGPLALPRARLHRRGRRTSTRATSPRTSQAARSTATCSCWVVVSANLMAMLVQTLSAKLGIATGRNLPETCRDNFRRPVSFGLWLQAEAIAMATDLAEVLGAALGLNLLFGMPLFPAGPAGRRGCLRDPGPPALRVPPARGGDRSARRRDRRRLRLRGLPREAEPCGNRQAHLRAGVRGHGVASSSRRESWAQRSCRTSSTSIPP